MKNVEEKALKKKLEEVDSCLASKFRLSVQLAQRAAQAQRTVSLSVQPWLSVRRPTRKPKACLAYKYALSTKSA